MNPFVLWISLIDPSLHASALVPVATTFVVPHPTAVAEPSSSAFTAEQLDQMVAPIALYPDSLLMQIFMAATYPLDIVQAARWQQKNPGLSGSALENALLAVSWDPSVKALCGFPQVLSRLNENLDWTQDLGDAALGQQSDLLAAVQRMRKIAFDSNQLKTTEQQVVVQQSPTVIVIEAAKPDVIYVPTYSPTIVYPGWPVPRPYYPALYVPPMVGGAMAFTAGAMWGAAVWGDCDWHGGEIDIDIDRYNEFNSKTTYNYKSNNTVNNKSNTTINNNSNNTVNNKSGNTANNKSGNSVDGDRARPSTRESNVGAAATTNDVKQSKARFEHDPSRRGGVNYRDDSTAKKYGGSGDDQRISRDEARGRSPTQPTAGTNQAGASSSRAGGTVGSNRTPTTSGSVGSNSRASTTDSGDAQRDGGGGGAFGGSRDSSLDRSSSQRGASSRGTRSYGGSGSSGRNAPSGGGGGRRR